MATGGYLRVQADGTRAPYDAVQRTCPICGTSPSSPRATFCSHRCQMIAFRRRLGHKQRSRELSPQSLTRPSRDASPECETRYLGEQRCCQCNLFSSGWAGRLLPWLQ